MRKSQFGRSEEGMLTDAPLGQAQLNALGLLGLEPADALSRPISGDEYLYDVHVLGFVTALDNLVSSTYRLRTRKEVIRLLRDFDIVDFESTENMVWPDPRKVRRFDGAGDFVAILEARGMAGLLSNQLK